MNYPRLFFFILSAGMLCSCVSAARHEYEFDSIGSGKIKRGQRYLDRTSYIGKCTFSFGAKGSDNLIIMTVENGKDFVFLTGGDWNLAIPHTKPFPHSWAALNTKFTYLGDKEVFVSGKKIIVSKILAETTDFFSTEFMLNDKYGLIGYRPIETNVQFIASELPESSLLNCPKD